jgi:adenine-specific DNA-methyltransferase
LVNDWWTDVKKITSPTDPEKLYFFWAIDFDWREGKPFEHHWQDYRTRKDRSLKTVSDFGYDKYPKKGAYTACVKVIDVFGCDTSITVEVRV